MSTEATSPVQPGLDLFPAEVLQPPITEVKLDDLPPNTQLIGDNPAGNFIDDIRKRGVRTPIMLMDNGQGGYTVVAGTRRIKAARGLKHETIPARIYPQGHLNQFSEAISENSFRADNVPREVVMIDGLRKQGHTDDVIISRLKLRKSTYLRRILLLDKLHPTLLAAFLSGQMSANTAEGAAKMDEEKQANLLKILEVKQTDLDEKTKEGKTPPKASLTAQDLKAITQVAAREALGGILDGEAPTLEAAANGHVPSSMFPTLLGEDDPNVTSISLHRDGPWAKAVNTLLLCAMGMVEDAANGGDPDAIATLERLSELRDELPREDSAEESDSAEDGE